MPDDTTVYYAQVGYDRAPENPYNVFRTVGRNGDQALVEVYDRTSRTWTERRNLERYTREGEVGADVITKVQAEAVIAGWAW